MTTFDENSKVITSTSETTPPSSSEHTTTTTHALPTFRFVSNLVNSGATWSDKLPLARRRSSQNSIDSDLDGDDAEGIPPNETVTTLSHVKYAKESPKQLLDLYYPAEYASRYIHIDDGNDVNDDNEEDKEDKPLLPVFIHVHGGGWSRGDKASIFYGAPSVCRTMASAGYLAIAIGYRLGAYPHFVQDAALAIKWIYNNVTSLGGDKTNMFLGGHSAGGHIASLLMVRHDTFLKIHDVPVDFVRGMVLLSGVYDLFDPLKKAPIDVKNRWFYAAYVLPAFGRDVRLRMDNSPLLLLDPEVKGDITTVSFRDRVRMFDLGEDEKEEGGEEVEEEEEEDPMSERTTESTPSNSSAPTLLGKVGKVVMMPKDAVVKRIASGGNSSNDDDDDDDDDANDETPLSERSKEYAAVAAAPSSHPSAPAKLAGKIKGVGPAVGKVVKLPKDAVAKVAGGVKKDKDDENDEAPLSERSDVSTSSDKDNDNKNEESAISNKDKETENHEDEKEKADDNDNQYHAPSKIIINKQLPPTLIMNATIDMGLEENGQLMRKAMSQYTEVQYVRVPGTDHASICWDVKAAEEMKKFVKSKLFVEEEEGFEVIEQS